MTTTRKKLTFEEYLDYDDGTDNRYELVDGELVALPPESEPNDWFAQFLFLKLVESGVPPRLVRPHTCEIQVPVLQLGDPQNRYPDLVVLREEHLALTQKRLTIKLDMPPPVFVVEVVSPGRSSRERDYDRKRNQYQSIGILEYWIIDPKEQKVTVLKLENGEYLEVGEFQECDVIPSPTFPALRLTTAEIISTGY
jgi:Uma2 family endonuclease